MQKFRTNWIVVCVQTYRKAIYITFIVSWMLVYWIIEAMSTAGVAVAVSLISALIISLLIIPIASILFPLPQITEWLGSKLSNFVLFVFSYLLTLWLVLYLSPAFADIFKITKVENIEFAFQAAAFVLYIGLFRIYRNPKQLQYGAYAVTYFVSVILDWLAYWQVLDIKLVEDLFVIPFKEAMLLFIIWDTCLTAKAGLKKERHCQL